jgi:hypothetical protein
MVRSISATGIADDTQSAAIVAEWQKAHLTRPEQEFMKTLGTKYVVGAENLGEFGMNVQGFRETFEGKKPGSVEDVAKKFISAAAGSKGTPAEISRFIEKVAPEAREAGLSPDQTLAAFSVFARTAPMPRTAASRVEQYIKGELDFTPLQRKQYQDDLAGLSGATGDIPDSIKRDPELSAARQSKRAKGAADEAWRGEGTITSLYDAMISQMAVNAKEGYGNAGYLTTEAVGWARGLTAGSKVSVMREAMDRPGSWPSVDADLQREIRDFLESQTQMMKSDRNQVPPPSGRQE